ncbi:RND transporter [Actinoplanes sp. OR16]|nr:RND transporter [Actinoplanes sp. OR16]
MIIAVLTLLLTTAASCDDEPSGIRVGQAVIGTVEEIVEAPGTVTAHSAATLTAPAAGTLADLRVASGDRVDKGDLLAVISSPELEQRRDAAEEALDETAVVSVSVDYVRTNDRKADKTFDHADEAAEKISDPALKKAFQEQIAAAEKQYEEAAEAAAAAVRSVQRGVAELGRAMSALSAAQRLQAEQAYQLADTAVEALSLKAPIAGVVQLGGVQAAPSTPDLSAILEQGGSVQTPQNGVDSATPEGGYVAAGAPVVTVVDTSEMGLTADVDETDVLLVEPGVAADVELDAAPGVAYTAEVRSSDLLPTTSARGGVSYRVRLDLKGSDPQPRPGMSAIVRLRVRQAEDAVTVPASAIISVDGEDTVWTVEDGRFVAAPVRLGVQGEDTVQVVSGVEAGQAVVVAGADQVDAGDEVP